MALPYTKPQYIFPVKHTGRETLQVPHSDFQGHAE